jgi:hypothetical protein
MVHSISGSTFNVSALSDRTISTTTSHNLSIDALDLVGADFRVDRLGTHRQILAGFERLDRAIGRELDQSHAEQGETAQSLISEVRIYVDGEGQSAATGNSGLLQGARALNPQTRESRMQAVVAAGIELLESARGTGLNLLNIAERTGLVVALTTVLRQMVGYYVEQAIREGDSPEASQAWEVAAIAMIGPAMSLIGAIRDECAGTASTQSRLGRVCMASIMMGALIAAHLTGASASMLTSAVNTTIYTFSRDVSNAFFPLRDNAGPATNRATGVSTVAYGAVQFALAELDALMPLSGAGRYLAGRDYSLVADLIQGGLNATGAVFDDFIFILCRSWPLLSPTAGLDCAISDPESLQRSVLQVRAGAQLPSWGQLANSLLNVNASRTSAFQAINLAVGAAAVKLAESDYGEDTQGHILNVCLMAMLMLIYFPFIWSCSQRTVSTPVPELTETPAP